MAGTVAKNLGKHGVLLAMETTSYGSGTPALSGTTDGFKVYETPDVEYAMQFTGAREGVTGTGGANLPPVLPAARSAKASLQTYFKGAGVAYSASVRSSLDRALRGLGLQATFSGGVGSEIVTYVPINLDQTLSSLVGEIYTRGQKNVLKGAFVSKFVMASSGLAVPKCSFDLQGIASAPPTDAAVPTITAFAPTVKNPKASNIGLTLATGGQTFTPVCRDFTITIEREITERVDQNDAAGNHPGFYLGDVKAMLEVVFEATPVVTGSPYASATAFDVYRQFENMREIDANLTIGATQYNKFNFQAATAHVQDFANEDREGPIATWGLTLQCDPSTEELLDLFAIVTD